MMRTVKTDLIDQWIEQNSPYGHEQLSVAARVSYPTVGDIRRGLVPGGPIRRRLANAIGCGEDELFPVISGTGEKAS